jgi:hypothetical protein
MQVRSPSSSLVLFIGDVVNVAERSSEEQESHENKIEDGVSFGEFALVNLISPHSFRELCTRGELTNDG